MKTSISFLTFFGLAMALSASAEFSALAAGATPKGGAKRSAGSARPVSKPDGLYAESLGRELGVYTDPYQRYGALTWEVWRAIRLVLDTGIHAHGWTREQAIAYARTNSPSSETMIEAEVERFMAIPGQALAYKIGELKLQELRRRAQTALGPRFDIKAFHRAILDGGALPLSVLDGKITHWIDRQRAR